MTRLLPEQKHGSAYIPTETMTDIYKSVIPNIGLLSEVQVRAVLRAYLLIEQLPDRIKLLAEHVSVDEPGYVQIGSQNFGHVVEMHQNYLKDIELAILALSG